MAYKFQTGATILSGSITGSQTITADNGFIGDGSALQGVTGSGGITGGIFSGSIRVARLEVDSTADYIDVSTDLQIVAAADVAINAGGGNVKPSANDGSALGVSGTGWSDLFLADGAVINVNAGNSTLTGGSALWQSNVALQATRLRIDSASDYIDVDTDLIAKAAADIVLSASGGNVKPGANDESALGVSATAWSDLSLASGGVINWDEGDVTLTHASNALTIAGGSLSVNGGVTLGGSGADTVSVEGIMSFDNGYYGNVKVTGSTTGIVSAGDFMILCSGSAAMNLRLPVISSMGYNGTILHIKRARGEGTLGMQHNVTISGSGNNTIDGDSSIILESDNASVTLIGSGSVWNVY